MSSLTASIVGSPTGITGSGERLNVLVLDEFLPFPPNAGKAIRTWNLLKPLAQKHSITLLCHGDERIPEIAESKAKLESENIHVELAGPLPEFSGLSLYARLLRNCFSRFPYSVVKHTTSHFRTKLTELLQRKNIDLVHCEWTPYARYMLNQHDVPFVVDAHNLEHLIWQRRSESSSNGLARLFFAGQAHKMLRFEREVFASAASVAAVSELESVGIRSCGARSVDVVHNGVDLERFRPSYDSRAKEFLFLGSLDWFPNQDAISYLLTHLVPQIRSKYPGATFRIVGRKPTHELRKQLEGFAEVHLSADVEDVLPFLHSAAALLVPLRIGGGTRIKILEAMAAGCPVISTSVGCEGLSVHQGDDILICDHDFQFADSCVRLLQEPQFQNRLAMNGRRLVEEHYSWTSAADTLDHLWRKASAVAKANRHA